MHMTHGPAKPIPPKFVNHPVRSRSVPKVSKQTIACERRGIAMRSLNHVVNNAERWVLVITPVSTVQSTNCVWRSRPIQIRFSEPASGLRERTNVTF